MAISPISTATCTLVLVSSVLGTTLPALADEPKGPRLPITTSGVENTPIRLLREICGTGKADTGLFKISLKNDMCLNGDSIRAHAESATTVADLLDKPIHGEVRTIGIMHAVLSEPQRVVLTKPTLTSVGGKPVSENGITIEPLTPKVFFAERTKVTCQSMCNVLIEYKNRQGQAEYTWFNNQKTGTPTLQMELFPGERTERISVWESTIPLK